MVASQAVAVLVWVTGITRDAIITGFARAADALGAAEPREHARIAAERFVAWLARTNRPWALVVDNLTDMSSLDGLWPSGPAGQVVITTRLPPAEIGGADAEIAPVGPFSHREALEYVTARITGQPDQRAGAPDLCEDLGRMPLELGQATAVVSNRQLSCHDYRELFGQRMAAMANVTVDDMTPEMLATWSLSAECAHSLAPATLGWPALALVSVMDPDGVPVDVLTTAPACRYVTGHSGDGGQRAIRAAFGNLARVGLVTIDSVRGVRLHSSVSAAVRAYLASSDLDQVIQSAADALLESWPEPGAQPEPEQAFLNCAAALQAVGGSPDGPLWRPEAHPLLFRAGRGLQNARLMDLAIEHWQRLRSTSEQMLGPWHAKTEDARENLGLAYEAAGRGPEAVVVLTELLTGRESRRGPEHPSVIVARGNLARACSSAGEPAAAIQHYERMAADARRALGAAHQGTLHARACLAQALRAAGRSADAIVAYQGLLADCERTLGAGHPSALAARGGLAASYQAAGQTKAAIDQYKRLLAMREAMHGPDHPDTIAVRVALAAALSTTRRKVGAIKQYERVLECRQRALGADHPDSVGTLVTLASAYRGAGLLADAISTGERAVSDSALVLGPDHWITREARSELASAYLLVGRLTDAAAECECLLVACENTLGPENPRTLAVRAQLTDIRSAAGSGNSGHHGYKAARSA